MLKYDGISYIVVNRFNKNDVMIVSQKIFVSNKSSMLKAYGFYTKRILHQGTTAFWNHL